MVRPVVLGYSRYQRQRERDAAQLTLDALQRTLDEVLEERLQSVARHRVKMLDAQKDLEGRPARLLAHVQGLSALRQELLDARDLLTWTAPYPEPAALALGLRAALKQTQTPSRRSTTAVDSTRARSDRGEATRSHVCSRSRAICWRSFLPPAGKARSAADAMLNFGDERQRSRDTTSRKLRRFGEFFQGLRDFWLSACQDGGRRTDLRRVGGSEPFFVLHDCGVSEGWYLRQCCLFTWTSPGWSKTSSSTYVLALASLSVAMGTPSSPRFRSR